MPYDLLSHCLSSVVSTPDNVCHATYRKRTKINKLKKINKYGCQNETLDGGGGTEQRAVFDRIVLYAARIIRYLYFVRVDCRLFFPQKKLSPFLLSLST